MRSRAMHYSNALEGPVVRPPNYRGRPEAHMSNASLPFPFSPFIVLTPLISVGDGSARPHVGRNPYLMGRRHRLPLTINGTNRHPSQPAPSYVD